MDLKKNYNFKNLYFKTSVTGAENTYMNTILT